MGSIFAQAYAYLKGIAVVSFGVKALKHLWPFLLIFIFWPEIDKGMSSLFPFWGEYVSSVTSVIGDGARYLRQLPFIEPVSSWLLKFWDACKQRLATVL